MHASNSALLVCHPLAARGEHYIDAAAFQRLFADPLIHFQDIGEALFLMARRIAEGVHFDSIDDRDDAIANVTLQALERIAAMEKHGEPRQAFAYFGAMIRRRLLNELRNQRRYSDRFGGMIEFEPE
jgi:DNA-directed RNA polymerase specialized sigma24 family protein